MPPYPNTVAIITAALLFCVGGAAVADGRGWPDRSELQAQLERVEDLRFEAWPVNDIDELLAGRTVIQGSGSGGHYADSQVSDLAIQGWRIVNAPRLLVWLTLVGGSDTTYENVTQATLEMREDGSYVKFQHVNLPWPIANRHWVILCEKDVESAVSSRGKIWRHHWNLLEDGEQKVRQAVEQGMEPVSRIRNLARSIYLPANHGAFTLIELSPRMTLVGAEYAVDLGGLFPGSIIRALSARRLRAGLADIDGRVVEVDRHLADVSSIRDGFGKPVQPAEVLRIAAEWRDRSGTAPVEAATAF